MLVLYLPARSGRQIAIPDHLGHSFPRAGRYRGSSALQPDRRTGELDGW